MDTPNAAVPTQSAASALESIMRAMLDVTPMTSIVIIVLALNFADKGTARRRPSVKLDLEVGNKW